MTQVLWQKSKRRVTNENQGLRAFFLTSRKKTQVESLGLLVTLFGQALLTLALTYDDLRSLWSRSNLHPNQCKFLNNCLATQAKSTEVEWRPSAYR